MTLSELRAQFKLILNRNDCSDDLANTFLGQTIQRVTREVRTLPSMERMVIYTPDTLTDRIQVPDDLIQLIDIYVTNMANSNGQYYDFTGEVEPGSDQALEKKSYRQLQAVSLSAAPTAYARQQAMFFIRGYAQATQQIKVHYFGEFSELDSDDAENELTASSPDLVIYGALSLASDYFDDSRGQAFEARYQQFLQQVMDQARDLEASGGPSYVSPMYET